MNISKESLQKIAAANQANPYADITPYETGVGMPIVHYSGFFAQPGECIIYAAPAQTFKDKNQVVGYTGKSAGASLSPSAREVPVVNLFGERFVTTTMAI